MRELCVYIIEIDFNGKLIFSIIIILPDSGNCIIADVTGPAPIMVTAVIVNL